MDYYSKREAKIMIMSALVDKGWKVFDYKADESDSMTDYFSPANWGGIATKNGYTLLVDICNYNLSDSGKEIREYHYNNKAFASNERIEKLTAMMNDAASTENEKASCAVLIKKEQDKAGVEPTYTVIETLPTFNFANPKGASWHIEREGQIIAKGNGAFAVNDYDWENKDKSREEQKAEKLNTLINRIEKALTDADALKPEIIKVPVTTVQVVEKEVTEITESDIKEGFTFVMKVGYTYGKSKGNRYTCVENGMFSKLGKNNKPSKSYDKMWRPSISKMNEMLCKGHIAVIEFVEVTEYVEKTVFKKTARKQTVSNVPVIEIPEAATVNEEAATDQTVEASNGAVMTINEELNRVELKFPETLNQKELSALYANGFRWSKRGGKWWAKQTPERLAFAESLVTSSSITVNEDNANAQSMPEEVTEVNTDSQNDNVIYYEFNQAEGVTEEQKEEGDTMEHTNTVNENENTVSDSFDDIFNKFDNINITADKKVSGEDLEFCKEQEYIYKELISNYNEFYEHLQIIGEKDKEHGKKYGNQSGTYFHTQNTAYYYSMSKYDFQDAINKIKNAFVVCVCGYFEGKYNITIDREKIISKYKEIVTCENIVDEIHEQMGGYNFTEKAEQEIKAKSINIFKYNDERITIRNNKLILNGYFVRHDSIWKDYRLTNNKEFIFSALSHFDSGSVKINKELSEKYCGYDNEKKTSNFEKYETQTLNKVKTIKFLKNGKMEIEFISNQVAAKFANEYCGYNQQTA